MPDPVSGRDDAVGGHRLSEIDGIDERAAVDAVGNGSSKDGMLEPTAARILCLCRGQIQPEQIAVEADAGVRDSHAARGDGPLQRGDIGRSELTLRDIDAAGFEPKQLGVLVGHHLQHEVRERVAVRCLAASSTDCDRR